MKNNIWAISLGLLLTTSFNNIQAAHDDSDEAPDLTSQVAEYLEEGKPLELVTDQRTVDLQSYFRQSAQYYRPSKRPIYMSLIPTPNILSADYVAETEIMKQYFDLQHTDSFLIGRDNREVRIKHYMLRPVIHCGIMLLKWYAIKNAQSHDLHQKKRMMALYMAVRSGEGLSTVRDSILQDLDEDNSYTFYSPSYWTKMLLFMLQTLSVQDPISGKKGLVVQLLGMLSPYQIYHYKRQTFAPKMQYAALGLQGLVCTLDTFEGYRKCKALRKEQLACEQQAQEFEQAAMLIELDIQQINLVIEMFKKEPMEDILKINNYDASVGKIIIDFLHTKEKQAYCRKMMLNGPVQQQANQQVASQSFCKISTVVLWLAGICCVIKRQFS